MSEKRRRSQRQSIDLEQLKKEPDSFLSWGIGDPVLRKLETYRLYQAGYAVADIAEAFGLSPGYLYEMWGKFKAEGTEALVDKRWGAAPRKRTTEREAEVLRAKALSPERGDSDLAGEFGLERSTVYRLLKEHGLQDLHRVLAGSSDNEPEERPAEAKADDGEKRGSKSSLVKKRYC
jgi:transposase